MAEGRPICSICLETFKDPRTIPCGHVFCSLCLKRYEEKNASEGRLACPLCNREMPVAPHRVSRVKKEAINETTISKEEIAPKCNICGPNVSATSRCLECEENYCQVCSVMHIKMKVSRNHPLCQLGVLYQRDKVSLPCRDFCLKHPEEEIKIVCKTCKNIPLCLFCKISDHDNHTSKILAEEVGEVKSVLRTKLTMCKVRLEQLQIFIKECEALDSIIDKSEQDEITTVNKQEEELIRILENQKIKIKQDSHNIRQDIRRVYQKVRTENDDCKTQIAKEMSECVTLDSKAKQLIDKAKDSQLVQIGCHLIEKLSEDSKRTGNIKLLGMQRKAFTPTGLSQQKFEITVGELSADITKERMNIFLRSCVKDQPLRLLETEPFEKISELKKLMKEKDTSLQGRKLFLTFREKELNDCNSVHEYGISNGSIIECSWTRPLWVLSVTSKGAIGLNKETKAKKKKKNKKECK